MMFVAFTRQVQEWIEKQGYQPELDSLNAQTPKGPETRFAAWEIFFELLLPDFGKGALRVRPQGLLGLKRGLAGLADFCSDSYLSTLLNQSYFTHLDPLQKTHLVELIGRYQYWVQDFFENPTPSDNPKGLLEKFQKFEKLWVRLDPWQLASLFCRFGLPLPVAKSSFESYVRYSGQINLGYQDWVNQLVNNTNSWEEALKLDREFELFFGGNNPLGLPSLCESSPLCPSCFLQGQCDFAQQQYQAQSNRGLENQLLVGQLAEIDSRQLILYLTGEKWQNRPLQNQWIDDFCQGRVLGQIPPVVKEKEDKAFYLHLQALELAGERLYQSNHTLNSTRISSAQDIFHHYRYKFGRLKQECFYVSILDNKHHQICLAQISQGILDQTLVHPREVFAPALHLQAAAVILIHNHPSGDVTPSDQDLAVTKRLCESGTLLGIKVLDHVILSESCYFSFAEQTLMP